MAGFHGSRGGSNLYPNLHNLNGIRSDYDLALQHQRQQQGQAPGYDFQADLDLFTNTQFFDFDMGEVPDTQSPVSEEPPQWSVSNNGAHGSVDFLNGSDLQQIHNYFPGSEHPSRRQSGYQATVPPAQVFSASSAASPTTPANQAGDKRKAENAPDGVSGTTTPANLDPEDASRVAAEEDKRRRNTAASARFRVKKKQREQALEKSAKEMTDRVNYLEQRVSTLEMENKLLKDLITEKSGQDVNVNELTNKLVTGAKQTKSASAAESKATDAPEKSKREVKIERADQKQR